MPIGKALEIVAAHNEPSRQAVHMAEHGLGSDNILETGRRVCNGDFGNQRFGNDGFGNDSFGLEGHGDPQRLTVMRMATEDI